MIYHYCNQTRGKKRTSRPTIGKISNKLPNFGSTIFGFLLGVFATCLLVFMFSTSDITLKIPTQRAKKPIRVAAAAAKPPAAAKQVQETRFDFYTELAKNEVGNSAPQNTVSDLKSAPKTINGYMVQAGSFKKLSDADAVKAKLALNGYSAKIEALKQREGEVLHRVLLGTFKNEQNAKATQDKLKSINIESILVLKYAD